MPPITHTQPPLPPALPSALPACRHVTVTSPLTLAAHEWQTMRCAHVDVPRRPTPHSPSSASSITKPRPGPTLHTQGVQRQVLASYNRVLAYLVPSEPRLFCHTTQIVYSTPTPLPNVLPNGWYILGLPLRLPLRLPCPSGFSLRRLPAPPGFSSLPLRLPRLRFPCDGIPAPQPPCAPRAAAAAAASPAHLTVAVGVLPGAVPSWRPCGPRTYAWLHRRPTPPRRLPPSYPQSRPTFPCYHGTATEHDHGPTHASSRIVHLLLLPCGAARSLLVKVDVVVVVIRVWRRNPWRMLFF